VSEPGRGDTSDVGSALVRCGVPYTKKKERWGEEERWG